jgi:K+-transporting ATPase ATPase A chain
MIPSLPGLLQAISLFAVAILLARPLGGYMRKVMEGERVFLSPVLRPIERGVYKVMRVDETVEQRAGLHMRFRSSSRSSASWPCTCSNDCRRPAARPGRRPRHRPRRPDLAYNTSVSFDTNTNWQNYLGENTMTYLTQMAGLAVRNFVSAATGIAVAIALTRGLVRKSPRPSATSGWT